MKKSEQDTHRAQDIQQPLVSCSLFFINPAFINPAFINPTFFLLFCELSDLSSSILPSSVRTMIFKPASVFEETQPETGLTIRIRRPLTSTTVSSSFWRT